MSKIIDFKVEAELEAAKQLDCFIKWAKNTLPKGIPDLVHESILWDMPSWHQSGVRNASFKGYASPAAVRNGAGPMQPPFIDFAKAMIVYHRVFLRKKNIADLLAALKALEAALVDLKGSRDVTQVSAAVCQRACEFIVAKCRKGRGARNRSLHLEKVTKFMDKKGFLATPFQWRTPIAPPNTRGTLKQQKQNRKERLPSRESIKALGELFNNDLSDPLDIVVTSACALLLSQPSRIGELADLERDCILFKDGVNGDQRMFLRWYAEKGFGATTKPVVKGMEAVVKRAVTRMLSIADDSRSYAAWLEDHPDEFPPHERLPTKRLDDPLTYAEACSALKYTSNKHHPRSTFKRNFIDALAKKKSLSPAARSILDDILEGWDTSDGQRIFVANRQGIQGISFEDKAVITLRKLNILVREKYLPKYFPYTTPPEEGKKRVKYRDALFTLRTGVLTGPNAVARLPDFGVEIAANPSRISGQLAGFGRTNGIFERHGYEGVRVNTHAFRHELNTEMHRAGLSQLLIDAFSGRTTMGSVYNHETVEERTQAVATVHPKTKHSNAENRLEKIRANAPLSLSDVTELAEGSQDRVVHKTHVGICVHNWASEPCPKMGSCLRCGKLACVKGDDEKLKNIKEERAYLQKRYHDAMVAESRGDIGATEWAIKVRKDLLKCDALIKLLEDPELEDGDIVWNADDGWNLTNNAAAMAGLVEPKVIEAEAQESLPSLDDLAALNDEVEV